MASCNMLKKISRFLESQMHEGQQAAKMHFPQNDLGGFGVFFTVDGKLEDGRPSFFPKASELGHSSSSEGEKECASPEWDVPLSKNSIRKSRPNRWRQLAFRPVFDESNELLFSRLLSQQLTVFSRSPCRR